VLIVAGSRDLLDKALEQRDGDDRLTEDTFEKGLEGLPGDALVKVYGDVGALVENDPDTEDARKVEWVAALDTFGLTAAVQEDQIAIDFDLTTDGDLSDEDLPLAAGGESPGVAQRKGEVGVGIRDLNHIYEFGQAAAQAVDPSGFGQFEAAKKQISDRLKVSIDDDVFGQLQGDVSVSLAVDGGYAARAELKDPDAFRETLKKAEPVLPSLIGGALGSDGAALRKPSGGNGLYQLSQPGGESLVFGVVGDALVVSDTQAGAARIASAQPEQVEGAKGSLAFKADAEQLADAFLSTQLSGIEALGGSLFTGPLGDLTGSVESSTDGLHGSFVLEID
jgi:hypothetical protein